MIWLPAPFFGAGFYYCLGAKKYNPIATTIRIPNITSHMNISAPPTLSIIFIKVDSFESFMKIPLKDKFCVILSLNF